MPAQEHAETPKGRFLGRGRSASVYLQDRGGKAVATKIFTGERLSRIVLLILTGSENPYNWCQSAVACAAARRRILSNLTALWFGEKLGIAQGFDYRWSSKDRAYELDTEYVLGIHTPLKNPLEHPAPDMIRELRRDIMNPLQEKLIESGMDGLVWQAGKGNPVAASNFMVVFPKQGLHRWIWIDIESGLPALFGMNPLATLTYYLPRSWKFRNWLFDDIDIPRLVAYLSENKLRFSECAFEQMQVDVALLAREQQAWKGLSRHRRSLLSAHSRGKIDDDQKDYFETRPVLWFMAQLHRLVVSTLGGCLRLPGRLIGKIKTFNFGKLFSRLLRYATSTYYRWRVIRRYIKKEIDSWFNRGFLTNQQRQDLVQGLHGDETSAYLTDFSIHLGLKPVVKSLQWGFVPLLLAGGQIGLGGAALIILWGGPLARTLYTLWRILRNLSLARPQYPWVALGVGLLPVAGNMAFPMEILYQTTGRDSGLGKFMVCSLSAKLGAKIPVWGGKDSEIEHFFNDIGYWFATRPLRGSSRV